MQIVARRSHELGRRHNTDASRVGASTDATADADNNKIGIFTLDAGVKLTSKGNVTIKADKIEKFGMINATGTETLIGQVVNRDLRNEIQDRIDESIEQANNSNFLPDLFEIASGGC